MTKNRLIRKTLVLGLASLTLLTPSMALAQEDQPVDKTPQLVEKIEGQVSLYLDGDYFCSFESQKALGDFIDLVKDHYKAKDGQVISMDLDLLPGLDARPDAYQRPVTSPEEAFSDFMSNGHRESVYILEADRSLEDLAETFDMDLETLREINPGISDDLSQGDEVLVHEARPLVDIRIRETLKETREIPFETQEIEDPELPLGQTRLVTEGVPGRVEVTSNRVRTDSQVLGLYVAQEKIVQEPVSQVIAIGTSESLATGTFINPSSGRLSSPFGPRWGRFHYGIDIANSTGTPIYAADGGTVTRVAYAGSYGNLVVIDHGNGYETRYAHCSGFDVVVGQEVSQGQQIARMGSTGRSTGPHLHFEIRLDGQALDPAEFVNY